MIASLMMYARPELVAAHERYWTAVRRCLSFRGIAAPPHLSQEAGEFAVWQDPEMVLSQTCGMPFRTRLHGTVQLVGTPDYGLDGCPAGYYRSAIVVRAGDPRATLAEFADARLAYNMSHSQSGFAAIQTHMQTSDIAIEDSVESGGHQRSAYMVSVGQADIAAIDAQTWRLLQRYESFSTGLRVLEYTTPTPGLPYITSMQHDPVQIRAAVQEAIATLDPADREALDLKGLVTISAADYMAVPTPMRQEER